MQPTVIRELSSESIHKTLDTTLQQHALFPWLTDTLSRTQQHHAVLQSTLDEGWHSTFAEGYVRFLSAGLAPAFLKQADCFYFNAQNVLHDDLLDTLSPANKKNILIIISLTDDPGPKFPTLTQAFRLRLDDPRWRFIFLVHPQRLTQLGLPQHLYAETTLPSPTQAETQAHLKQARTRLEHFHQVVLPDDILALASALSDRWLKGEACATKTLQLLDSAAARAALQSQTPKPVVSPSLLMTIVSDWTRVPVTHLQGNRFLASHLTDILRKSVFGQDDAIHHISRLLQTACLRFQDQPGPFCHFLLLGPTFSGKRTLAARLAHHITGFDNGLIRIQPLDCFHTRLQRIRDQPYAVILIENIDTLSKERFPALLEMLTQGQLTTPGQATLDLRHALIILTAATHTNPIQVVQNPPAEAKPADKSIDLMNLVLGTPQENNTDKPKIISPLENDPYDSSARNLPNALPDSLKACMHPVHCAPLSMSACETIIRSQLILLTRQLKKHRGLSLEILPEVAHFLTLTLHQSPTERSAEQLIEALLIPRIAHCFYGAENISTHTATIQVRLNGHGNAMVCEFMSLKETAQH